MNETTYSTDDRKDVGITRKLYPEEIAKYVKWSREMRNLSQYCLSIEAHLSEKTIERIESGINVQPESLERVAVALSLDKDAFTKSRYIPTSDEIKRQIKDAEEAFVALECNDFNSERCFDDILLSHAYIVDDHKVYEKVKEITTALKADLSDWGFIYEDLDIVERLDAREQLYKHIDQLHKNGMHIKYSVKEIYHASLNATCVTGVIIISDQKFPANIMIQVKDFSMKIKDSY